MKVQLRPSQIKGLSIAIGFAFLAFFFQNCSNDMEFKTIEKVSLQNFTGDDVICNPLSGAVCDLSQKTGLVGYLYYLTQDQAGLFNDSLHNTVLADYIQHGHFVNKVVLMDQINVDPQSWEVGFALADGNLVQDKDGNALYEWFSLDLYGYISLPAGDYQFAILSDDGMKVVIDDQTLLNDDGLHAPRWRCSSDFVNFAQDEKRKINVQYFQGPRTKVSMKMMVRPATESASPCDATGGWSDIPASAYSY